jgi:hypothetical protein
VAISTLVAAISGTATSAISYAQEEPPPPFQFAQTDVLELSWTTLPEEGVEVDVENNTTKRLEGLKVKLSGLGLRAPKDSSKETSAVKNSEAITYDQSLSLSAAGSSKIKLGAVDPAPELAPDGYTGNITVSQVATDTVIRRPVQLSVEDPQAKSAPTPLVEDWTVHAYRVFPLIDALPWIQKSPIWFVDQPVRLSGQSIPLNAEPAEKSKVDFMKDNPLGFVGGGPGSAAVVSSTGESVMMPDNVLGLKLAFDGLGRPGQYEGKLDFDPDDEETVALTVDVKDLVLWPVLTLLLGLWLGTRAKRYLGKGRKVSLLQERAAQAGERFDKAQKDFEENAKGKPYGTYRIKDMTALRTDLQEKLKRLANASLATLNESDPDYQVIMKDLERLETTAQIWETFRSVLEALEKALGTATAKAQKADKPPPPFTGRPSC